MQDEVNTQRARALFTDLCETMDRYEWKYEANKEKLTLDTGYIGADVPVRLRVLFKAERQAILYYSQLPFRAEDNHKRIKAIVATAAINDKLKEGAFYVELNDGTIAFRLTHSFVGSEPDGTAMLDTVRQLCRLMDRYNDHLLLLCKGLTTVEELLDFLE